MYDLPSVRNALVEYFESTAAYRESLIDEEKLWETKNQNYAKSLRLVVKHIRTLPDDDPMLMKLAACPGLFFDDGTVFTAPQDEDGRSETNDGAVHCGPRFEPMSPRDCAEWFESWAETAVEEDEAFNAWAR